MKDVSLFLLKKVFKSRLNWIILALFVSVLGVTFYFNPNHSYLSQLDVTYKTPDLMSHFLPPHEISFTFCCSSIVFPR